MWPKPPSSSKGVFPSFFSLPSVLCSLGSCDWVFSPPFPQLFCGHCSIIFFWFLFPWLRRSRLQLVSKSPAPLFYTQHRTRPDFITLVLQCWKFHTSGKRGGYFIITSGSQEAMQFPLALAERKLKAMCWLPLSKEHTLGRLGWILFGARPIVYVHRYIGTYVSTNTYICIYIHIYIHTHTNIHILHTYKWIIINLRIYVQPLRRTISMCRSLLGRWPVAYLPPTCGKCLLFLDHLCLLWHEVDNSGSRTQSLCWWRASQLELNDIILESLEINNVLTVPSFCHRIVSFIFWPKSVSSRLLRWPE